MSKTLIKSCKKYRVSYKDSSNNLHQLGIFSRDSYNYLMLAKAFYRHINDHPNSVTRIQPKVRGN